MRCMPTAAKCYKVVIASPSDMIEERRTAMSTISKWTNLNSDDGVVLIPVLWPTNTVPLAGEHPQASINRQIIDPSDIMVAMFWTRLGSPTDVAEAATVEEIERFLAAGKPVLLYFSSRLTDPTKLDLDQLQKLDKFKRRFQKGALFDTFKSLRGLRRRLQKHLVAVLRTLPRQSLSIPPHCIAPIEGAPSGRPQVRVILGDPKYLSPKEVVQCISVVGSPQELLKVTRVCYRLSGADCPPVQKYPQREVSFMADFRLTANHRYELEVTISTDEVTWTERFDLER